MIAIADPVLTNMSQGKLRENMPVETISGEKNPRNARTTHLEALGRLFAGIAPWLELGGDDTHEGKLRAKYIDLTIKSIQQGFDPSSKDYLNFTVTRQPLVDAAFFGQGLLRSRTQVWDALGQTTQERIIKELKVVNKIKPYESNWLLFSAMVEATLLELTGEWNQDVAEYSIMRFKEWYKGDGWYGDGSALHIDYYNSYVIHPMLLDLLNIMQRYDKGHADFHQLEVKRFKRYAEQLERLISPEGTYPVVGRSIAYRFGAFYALAQAAQEGYLENDLPLPQVRCALTAVIRRHMQTLGNFDENGWLTLGFFGHQPQLAERYISTGSLYLCSVVFLPLGLAEDHEFWSGPYTEWTGKKIWGGAKDVKIDKALKD